MRFELTRPFGLPVFKTGAINRSATPPERNTVREECAIAANLSKPKTTLAALCKRPRGMDRRSQTAATEEWRSTVKYVHVNLTRASEKEVPSRR